jgi:hypothetical protein
VTFGELKGRLNSFFGNESPATAVANFIAGTINRAYEHVVRHVPTAYWLRRHFSFNTLARVSTTGSTGIAAAVGGSPIVTMGSGLRLDRRHIGGYLRINGQQETYLVKDVTRGGAYPGAGSNFIVVDPPYSGVAFGSTQAATDAEFLQMNYRLPPDFVSVYGVRQNKGPLRLWQMEPMGLDQWVPNAMILGQRGNPVVYLIAQGGWLPDYWGTKVITTNDLASGAFDGTAVFTNGSVKVADVAATSAGFTHNLVLSADSTLDADRQARNTLQGRHVRLSGDPRWYRISDVRDLDPAVATSKFQLLLEEPFQGTTTAVGQFTIDGSDAGAWIRFYPVPDTVMNIDVEYHSMPPILQGANEEPRIPAQFHGVILSGALMELARYMNDSRAIIYEREFMEGLDRVRSGQKASADKVYVHQAVPSFDLGVADTIGTWPNTIETS